MVIDDENDIVQGYCKQSELSGLISVSNKNDTNRIHLIQGI